MKKLMMTAVVACVASFASATGYLTWTQKNGNTFTIDGVAADGNAVLLVVCATGKGAPTLSWGDSGLVVNGAEGDTIAASLGSRTLSSGTVTALQSETTSWATGNTLNGFTGEEVATWGTGTGNKVDFYEFIFDSGDINANSKYQLASTLTGKYASKENATITLSFAGAALSSENWNNIPEPCTVALLALGMGALALRRKQR